MSLDNGSITRVPIPYDGNHADTPHFTTRCEAKVHGVACQVPTLEYFTTLEGEQRYVCDEHFRDLLRLIASHYFMRQTYAGMFNEGGKVA